LKNALKILSLFFVLLLALASCSKKNEPAESVTAPVTDVVTESETEEAAEEPPHFIYKEKDGGAVITEIRILAEELEIPAEIDGLPVVEIADRVFSGIIETHSVVIPEGVVKIGASAFEGCRNLKEVSIPSTAAYIGERAFRDTPWFEELADEFTVVGDGVLIKYSGEATDVTVPDGVKFLSDAFSSSEIASVTLHEGLSEICPHAFSGSKALSVINFPSSPVAIGASAFTFCQSLKEITLPSGVTSLGEYAFSRCPVLERVTINAEIDVLKKGTFMSCPSLKEVVLPDTLTTVAISAFDGCISLESVNLPESVTTISDGAFDDGATVTVTVTPGSYAEEFCTERGINFVN